MRNIPWYSDHTKHTASTALRVCEPGACTPVPLHTHLTINTQQVVSTRLHYLENTLWKSYGPLVRQTAELMNTMRTYRGSRRITPHSLNFDTRSSGLPPQKGPRYTGGGLNVLENRKSFAPTGIWAPDVPARSLDNTSCICYKNWKRDTLSCGVVNINMSKEDWNY
jgi:hypothetical protein